jgi:hypothetical protein
MLTILIKKIIKISTLLSHLPVSGLHKAVLYSNKHTKVLRSLIVLLILTRFDGAQSYSSSLLPFQFMLENTRINSNTKILKEVFNSTG